jgi:histone H3/H4
MKMPISTLLAALLLLLVAIPGFASITGKLTREVLEQTVEKTAKKSGRTLSEQGAKKAAGESVERLAKTYGVEVLPVVEDGGLELLEAVQRYGDEVITIAAKASPQARRAFAMNVPELLPLARRVGVESLELEAKAPGLSSRAFQVFGDDAGKAIAKTVPGEDVPRLLKYGELADSPKTRQMLLNAYEKEGKSLFERVPPKLVLASGLSGAMLLGTYEVTAPDRALAKSIEDNPDMAKAILSQKVAWAAVLTFLVVGILLWRFGLMPWHRKAVRATIGKKGSAKTHSTSPMPPSGSAFAAKVKLNTPRKR